jgi:hypothetical protein
MIIPSNQEFLTYYYLKHPEFSKRVTFKYYDAPIMGLGPKGLPFIRMNDYIDDSEFPAIYQELENNKQNLVPYTKGLVVNGIVPKEYNGGVKSIDSYLLNPDKYINFDYEQDISHLDTLSKVKSYFYNKFNVPEAWQGVCHMREFTTYENKNKPSNWLPLSDHFPLLKKFVDSLPFKSLGYALFFISNGNGNDPVFVHRDIFHQAHHKSNFINITFDKQPRPFFLFDGITKEKIYLDTDCSMYMFNESDLHGVDLENRPRYMLRVEGVFTDDFAEKIGLIKYNDYYEAFDWSYPKPRNFLESIGLNLYKDTDI